jgi:short subunit dehydrogenase-like uncharacterized protein
MTDQTWLLYGANGYTGRLIAREAASRGQRPVLTGRNSEVIRALAKELHCCDRVFGLESVDDIITNLADVRAVLNCAGPFSNTAPPLLDACLRAKVHYLDITGEIDVIEAAAALDGRAREAGVTLLPAVGFDVVPSDCLAAMLAECLPSATHLVLAFTGSGDVSPGTAKTLLEVMPGGGRARIDGKICRVPADWKKRAVPFPSGTREAVTIPWGDVASAYYSTAIPNIETYLAASPILARRSLMLHRFSRLLRFRTFRKVAQWLITRSLRGPSDDERGSTHVELWGQVSDGAGNVAEAALITPNGYTLTVHSALASVEQLLAGNVLSGFLTPSQAFGKDFVLTLPGTRVA